MFRQLLYQQNVLATRYEVLLIASVGLVIVIGVLVHLWRSKQGGMR